MQVKQTLFSTYTEDSVAVEEHAEANSAFGIFVPVGAGPVQERSAYVIYHHDTIFMHK